MKIRDKNKARAAATALSQALSHLNDIRPNEDLTGDEFFDFVKIREDIFEARKNLNKLIKKGEEL